MSCSLYMLQLKRDIPCLWNLAFLAGLWAFLKCSNIIWLWSFIYMHVSSLMPTFCSNELKNWWDMLFSKLIVASTKPCCLLICSTYVFLLQINYCLYKTIISYHHSKHNKYVMSISWFYLVRILKAKFLKQCAGMKREV